MTQYLPFYINGAIKAMASASRIFRAASLSATIVQMGEAGKTARSVEKTWRCLIIPASRSAKRRARRCRCKGFAMDTSDVRVEIKDHIATVTMDRPPVNAMSQSLVEGLAEAFDSFDDLPEVR